MAAPNVTHLESVPHHGAPTPTPTEEVEAEIEKALASSARARAALRRKPAGPTLVVRPKNLGRVTGFVVVCPDHGAMEVAAPSRSSAIEAARDHLRQLHRSLGTVDARGLAPVGSKKKKRRR